MSIPSVSPLSSIAALRAYQQVKQHGEPLPDKSEALALLEREQRNAGTEAGMAINAEALATTLSTEEQRQTQLELERSWGLMSAILGTQFDEYA
ncbi:hypothetical protein H8K52_13330 [Undibacterium seohonense]|uniref:Uncharacterized protein n=1 Tax=Undibacterium seohonense TaxID=1344950 RepID=A0ABR6X6X2_9BURK|nr:hypothetical protein [Undibacterium seohonense]MBC3808330.1 hypothetical protein [Undibacterium seohonense]